MTAVVIDAKSDVPYLNPDINLNMYLHGLAAINHSICVFGEGKIYNFFFFFFYIDPCML